MSWQNPKIIWKHYRAKKRAVQLKEQIIDYLANKENIPTGFNLQEEILARQEKIRQILKAEDERWQDWHWQLKNRLTSEEVLAQIINLPENQKTAIRQVSKNFRWAISPYYASLISSTEDPIGRQAIPSLEEIRDKQGVKDPMAEELTSPVLGLTRRYPDRLIINVTNQCAMYCRHCQRRRNIGEVDRHKTKRVLAAALAYIKANPEIRDVLLTGGDALLLPDRHLNWLLDELDNIKHVEIKRIGTRTIVTLPQRITPELCAVLEAHPPVYINTQFNHPREITPEAAQACARLVKAGVILGNQAVLLKGVNNDLAVIKKLHQELLKIRVRPYYLFQAKQVKGTGHFITPLEEGIAIMEKLRGYTSGLAVPTFIINAPGGYGKVPVLPQYVVRQDRNKWLLHTWEKRSIPYVEQLSE